MSTNGLTEELRPEANLPENVLFLRTPDGRFVRRVTMQNGNVQDETVFPGDFVAVRGAKKLEDGSILLEPADAAA